jgi:2-polyprenyl-3-methyl-5-hydroxy-6-metoxy-1,4-benzoquinol methylase
MLEPLRGTDDAIEKSQVTVNYHWENAEPPPSYRYNAQRILHICKELGARRVLDLGCGNGPLARALSQAGFQVTACDVDRRGIEIASQGASGVRFLQLGVYDDPAELNESDFDVVVCAEVIEHLYIPRQVPRFARAVLKPEGHLVVSTPYHGYLKNLAISILNKWEFHHNSLEEGGHIKFFSPKILAQLLKEEQFEVGRFHFVGRVHFFWNGMIAVARQSAHGLDLAARVSPAQAGVQQR